MKRFQSALVFGLILAVMVCKTNSFIGIAFAQTPVVTQPAARATLNGSSTITVTDTFQSLYPINTLRFGCTVQNTGTNAMYVFFGPIASATLATSVKLTAGQSTNCNVGNIVLRDQVSITGTSGETFYAAQQ